jgi:hypothetical protein
MVVIIVHAEKKMVNDVFFGWSVTGKEVTKQLIFDGLYIVNAKFILKV